MIFENILPKLCIWNKRLFSPYSCEDPVLQGQIQMKYDSKASKSSANTVVDFTSAKGIAHKNMAGFDFKNSVLLF